MHAKISIVLKSFEVPPPLNNVGLSKTLKQTGGSPFRLRARSIALKQIPVSIRLPKKQALFTVLRSPHIDKKSREQFSMRIHKQLIVQITRKVTSISTSGFIRSSIKSDLPVSNTFANFLDGVCVVTLNTKAAFGAVIYYVYHISSPQ